MMNIDTASPKLAEARTPRTFVRALLHQAWRLIAMTAVYGAVLFAAAGTVRWPAAWLYLAVSLIVLGGYVVIVARLHPDLVAERTRPPADAKSWDKILATVVAIFIPLAMIVVAGLDRRFGWSPAIGVGVKLAGLAVFALGACLSDWAVSANRFFSAIVRIQRDRGHKVVDHGPYAFVRHPSYVGSLFNSIGVPLVLGSLWTFIPSGIGGLLIVLRTALEDRTLQNELEGYREYATRVRWRLVPFIW